MRRAVALAVLVAAAAAQRQAPAPPPTPRSKDGSECDAYCCKQTNRDDCCGAQNQGGAQPCPFGNQSGYCSWTGDNLCQRNCYPREGPCAEIELCFNLTADPLGQVELDAIGARVATDANLLIGGAPDSVAFVSAVQNDTLELLTIILRCPEGGCGTFDYITERLCFAGMEVPNTGGQSARVAVDGFCLKEGPDGLTEAFPKAEIADMQPVRVTARSCQECVVQVTNTTYKFVDEQWLKTDLEYSKELVTNTTISPAFLDSPALDEFCNIPELFLGMYHFRMNHSLQFGAQIEITCPSDCVACDVYLLHYHDAPCSSDTNGNWPMTLPLDGWSASSCAPCLTDGGARYPMVTYRRQMAGGTTVKTPAVSTTCLKYFGLFAAPGVNCEGNELQDEAQCSKAGGLCVWKDGECKTEYCPRRPSTAAPTSDHSQPRPCVPAPGLDCESNITGEALDRALASLPQQ